MVFKCFPSLRRSTKRNAPWHPQLRGRQMRKKTEVFSATAPKGARYCRSRELKKAGNGKSLPPYNNKCILYSTHYMEEAENICDKDSVTRLVALSDLYKIYIPSFMSVEIYSKLYLSLIRSLNKKQTKIATVQQNENFKAVLNQEYRGMIGGSDSFTIIGNSGIGKSSAISRAIELITENRVIETEAPYSKIIPCVTVQCPFDSSVKGSAFGKSFVITV